MGGEVAFCGSKGSRIWETEVAFCGMHRGKEAGYGTAISRGRKRGSADVCAAGNRPP
jgi:hypothetical protein